jgi:hypothetical protein
MADLLTHVLVAYALLTVVSWRLDWLTRPWIAVGMGGAIIPDLQRLDLLLDSQLIESATGLPFTYSHFGTIGGLALTAGVITVLFERRWWLRVYGLLVAGGITHLVLDGTRVWADGRAGQWLFPILPAWRPPSPNLYITADPLVPAVTLTVAAVVFLIDRRRTRTATGG